MKCLAAALALVPAAAFAHGGATGHGHPHGIEGALIAAALAGLVLWAIARARR